MKYVLSFLIILFSLKAICAESSSTMNLDSTPQQDSERNWTLFLTGYPVPLVGSEGMGGALEYKINSLITGNFTLNKMTNIKEDNRTSFGLGKSDKDVNLSYSAGIKYIPYSLGRFGFYLGTGYMVGENSSEYQPGLFGGPQADKNSRFEGIYGALGCRFVGAKMKRFTWVFDASINYNPGASVEKNYYVAGDLGHQVSRLETTVGYGIQPTAYIGGMF